MTQLKRAPTLRCIHSRACAQHGHALHDTLIRGYAREASIWRDTAIRWDPPPRNPILAGKSVWFFPLREKGGFLENTASMYMYRECTARRHARYSKGELLSILFLPRAKARALASADHPLHRGPASGSCGAGGGRVSSRSSSMSSASAPRPMRPPFSAQAMCAPLFAPRPSRFVEEQGGCRSACVAVVAPRR